MKNIYTHTRTLSRNLLLLNFLIVFFIFIFSSCTKDNSVKSDIPDTIESKKEIVFTKSDKAELDLLLNNGNLRVINNVLYFEDFTIFNKALSLIYRMQPNEYLKFIKEIGFNSIREDILLEEVDFTLPEYEGIVALEQNSPRSLIAADRLISRDGLKIIGQNLIFQDQNKVMSCFIPDLEEEKITIDYIKTNTKEFLEIGHEVIESRSLCQTTEWENERSFVYDGKTRIFTTNLKTDIIYASPIYSGGIFTGFWDIGEGFTFENVSERIAPWRRGWGRDLYCKIDAYITGNPNKQWVFKTCNDCKRLDHAQTTRQYVSGATNIWPPKFNPLEWFVSQMTNVYNVQFTQAPWGFVPGGNGEICANGYGNDIPRYCWGCSN